MTFDVHYHTMLTKRVAFSHEWLAESMTAARVAGLDMIIMTDHFNSRDFDFLHTAMRNHYERVGDAYRVCGMLVFPGMEVDVIEGPHILVTATSEACDRLASRLRDHREEGTFVAAAKLFDLVEEERGILTLAHPLRPGREITRLDRGDWGRLDALDLNGKDLFDHGSEMTRRVNELAMATGLPVVGGSDTHHFLQAGCVWNEVRGQVDRIDGLRALIRAGTYEVKIDPCLVPRVYGATIAKRTIKQYVYGEL